MGACLPNGADVNVVARPGASVQWGLSQLNAVSATNPDLILIEFSINDADLRDGLSLAAAQRAHGILITGLQAAQPQAALVLLTMSPAQGLRGLIRPRLAAHYRQYRTLAAHHDLGLIDLYPRWRNLPRSARGLQRDGLHPEPEVATGVIVPILMAELLRALGKADCHAG